MWWLLVYCKAVAVSGAIQSIIANWFAIEIMTAATTAIVAW
ncbi:hypothetical protein X566_04445 [Afipia sp. P52-10]|nr:hypothetical protein X566_04445 [Afipia sp. P52-10]